MRLENFPCLEFQEFSYLGFLCKPLLLGSTYSPRTVSFLIIQKRSSFKKLKNISVIISYTKKVVLGPKEESFVTVWPTGIFHILTSIFGMCAFYCGLNCTQNIFSQHTCSVCTSNGPAWCSGYITGKPRQRPSACVACRCSQGIIPRTRLPRTLLRTYH